MFYQKHVPSSNHHHQNDNRSSQFIPYLFFHLLVPEPHPKEPTNVIILPLGPDTPPPSAWRLRELRRSAIQLHPGHGPPALPQLLAGPLVTESLCPTGSATVDTTLPVASRQSWENVVTDTHNNRKGWQGPNLPSESSVNYAQSPPAINTFEYFGLILSD